MNLINFEIYIFILAHSCAFLVIMKSGLRFVGTAVIYLTFFRAFSVVASEPRVSNRYPTTMIRCKDAADQVSRSGYVVEGEVQCPDLSSTTLQSQRFLWIYNEQTDCGGFVRVRSRDGRFRFVLPTIILPPPPCYSE